MKTKSISRRTFIAGTGAATASLLSPTLRAKNHSDVIVIGAGLSGLNTALILEEEGLSVTVLEAQERVGGRVMSMREVPGSPESGGTSMGAGYARIVDTSRRLGVPLVDITPVAMRIGQREIALGGNVIPADAWPGSSLNPFQGDQRALPPWAWFGAMTRGQNPLEAPEDWLAGGQEQHDIAVYDWLRARGATDAEIELGYNTNISFGESAHDISMLMLWFVQAFANSQRQLATGGIFGYVAENGNQSIPEAMAAALRKEVVHGAEVVAMEAGGEQAAVTLRDGSRLTADRIVCSMPLPVLRRTVVDPIITGPHYKAIRTVRGQLMTLVHLVAKSPFWEDDGFAPAMFTDTAAGIIFGERRGSDPDEITSMTAWARGPRAAQLDQMPEADARALVVSEIERLRPAAKGKLEVLAYKSWYRDPWCGGDWAYWQPGQISELGNSVSKPHGRIHFCGEHTAVSNRGMEGAMESAERAALEVLETV